MTAVRYIAQKGMQEAGAFIALRDCAFDLPCSGVDRPETL